MWRLKNYYIRWVKYYNDLAIRKKLILLFSIAVIPVILGGLFLTDRMKNNDFEQSIQEARTEIQRVKGRLQETMELINIIQNSIISDSKVKEIILQKYDDTLNIVRDYNYYKIFSRYELMHKEIDDIRVYANNNTLLNNMDFMCATEEIQQSKWYINAIGANGDIQGEYYYDTIKNKGFFMVNRYFKSSREIDAVIMILIDLEFLRSLVSTETYDILILDSKDGVIASKDSNKIGKTLDDVDNMYIENKLNMWQQNYNGLKSQLILESIHMGDLNIKLLAVIPIEEILKPANQARALGLIVVLLSLATALYFSWIFANVVTRRVHQLKSNMDQVAKGEFDQLNTIEGNDEFGELSRNLQQMADSLKTLIQENIQMHKKEQQLLLYQEKMRFSVLANQVNPHFLFNVLESIRMKAHIQGEKELANIVRLLGTLIRRNLEMTDEQISIKEELDFVESYLIVQKFRFGDRITIRIDYPKELEEYKILPLTIQPIVENAIIHGLERSLGDGKICVDLAEKEDQIVIKVRDNGKGIPVEKLQKLKQNLVDDSKKEKARIGIRNIHQRIHIRYGKIYGVNIESSIDQGTCVTIRIPKIVGEEQ